MNGDYVSTIQFERDSFHFYKKDLIRHIFSLPFSKEILSHSDSATDSHEGKSYSTLFHEKMVISTHLNTLREFRIKANMFSFNHKVKCMV